MGLKQIAAVVVTLSLLSVPQGYAQTAGSGSAPPRMAMGQMQMPNAGGRQAGGTTSESLVIGAGAVVGYVMMLTPVGSALMGAAMGAMLAASAYGAYYGQPAAPATAE